ncbi:hypothetical protein GCM10027562_34070 [Arthrobacter pigmenti]
MALGITGCAGEPEVVTKTVTETVTPDPVEIEVPVDDGVDPVAGGGAFPDDFFVANMEDDHEDLYTLFGNEAQVVEWAVSVCGMFDRGGMKADLLKILEENFAGPMEVTQMEIISMDSTFNYCPEYKHLWLEEGEEWVTYKTNG